MLKPELQDEDQYADSLLNLVEAGKIVASRYFGMVASIVHAHP